jgi:[ribosomal protein S5]-alanine N-acetyltransferase
MSEHLKPFYDALTARPIFHTQRLILRTPAEQDIPALIEIVGDWEVASRLARIPHPYTVEHARYFLEEVVPHELVWSIIDLESGEMAGAIGLAPYAQVADTVELGYYLGRSHWGRGIATEAGSCVAAFGAGLVGQQRLKSGYFADNPSSGRVLEKLGFVQLGMSERHCLTTDELKPSIEMGYPETEERK